jgi:hypothetical protein
VTPLAPVLTALLADLRAPDRKRLGMPGDAQVLRLATAELARLKAVVRALDRMLREDRTRHPGHLPGSWLEAASKGERALARLEAAGRRKEEAMSDDTTMTDGGISFGPCASPYANIRPAEVAILAAEMARVRALARDAALEEAALLVESAAGYWPSGLRVALAIRARKGTR